MVSLRYYYLLGNNMLITGMLASGASIHMFTIKLITGRAKPDIVLRTSVNGWRDQPGQYRDGAWEFTFDQDQPMDFKFVATPDRWMLGNDLHIDPSPGQVQEYQGIQFQPARKTFIKSLTGPVLITWIIVLLAGTGLGFAFLLGARQNQRCPAIPKATSWRGAQLSGLPSTLQSSFGYARGTQIIESTITVTPRQAHPLPTRIAVTVEPLVTASGVQVITPSPTGGQTAGGGVSAVAYKLPSSQTYQLAVCIKAPDVTAGAYSSRLLFPGAKLASGTSLPVTVTFQSWLAPFALWVGVPLLGPLGLVYTTLVLIRRANHNLRLEQLPQQLRAELLSVNGLLALITSVGVAYATGVAQVSQNPTWGSPWTAVLPSLGTIVAAAATAATVPMSLSSKGNAAQPADPG